MIFRTKDIRYLFLKDGYAIWFKGIFYHRVYKDNIDWSNGKCGPAVILPNGYKAWYKNGIKVKEKCK